MGDAIEQCLRCLIGAGRALNCGHPVASIPLLAALFRVDVILVVVVLLDALHGDIAVCGGVGVPSGLLDPLLVNTSFLVALKIAGGLKAFVAEGAVVGTFT